MATDGGSLNWLSKLGKLCKWKGEVLIRLVTWHKWGWYQVNQYMWSSFLIIIYTDESLLLPGELCLPSCYYFSHYLVAESIWFWSLSPEPRSNQASQSSPSHYRYLLGMGMLCTECSQSMEKRRGFLLQLLRHGQKIYIWYPKLELGPCFFMVEKD